MMLMMGVMSRRICEFEKRDLDEEDYAPSADDADNDTEDEFAVVVDLEDHATATNGTAQENRQTEPERGVELENERESH